MRYSFKDLVIDSRTGLNPRKNFRLGNGTNYYITIKDIRNGRIEITNKTDRIDDEAISIIKKRSRIKNGDILFTSIGRIGETAIVYDKNDTWEVNESIFIFTLNKKIIQAEFFCVLLQSPVVQDRLAKYSSGSTFKSIKMNQLEKMFFDIPEIEEQKKISLNFNKVTHTIDICNQILDRLDLLVKARFMEMFGETFLNTGGYPIKALSDIAEYWNGLTYKPDDVSENGTIVLRSGNIQNSQLDFTDIVRVSCEIDEKKYVKPNDILMCSRNGSARLVGKVALIKEAEEPMCFGAFMMIIRSHYYYYLMTYFQMPAFREQITASSTTTINQITVNMLNNISLPVPPLNEVTQFADFIEQTEKSKSAVKQMLEKAEMLKKSLMQKYFR